MIYFRLLQLVGQQLADWCSPELEASRNLCLQRCSGWPGNVRCSAKCDKSSPQSCWGRGCTADSRTTQTTSEALQTAGESSSCLLLTAWNRLIHKTFPGLHFTCIAAAVNLNPQDGIQHVIALFAGHWEPQWSIPVEGAYICFPKIEQVHPQFLILDLFLPREPSCQCTRSFATLETPGGWFTFVTLQDL